MGEITVRQGKGFKDRLTILPESLMPSLQDQIKRVEIQHQQDMQNGFGSVYLPYGLERRFRNAHRELGWHFLFPAATIGQDPRTRVLRRHHIHASLLQKAVKQAARGRRHQQEGDAAYPAATVRHSFIDGRL